MSLLFIFNFIDYQYFILIQIFMHELSVALGIVNIAEHETKKAHAKSVEL